MTRSQIPMLPIPTKSRRPRRINSLLHSFGPSKALASVRPTAYDVVARNRISHQSERRSAGRLTNMLILGNRQGDLTISADRWMAERPTPARLKTIREQTNNSLTTSARILRNPKLVVISITVDCNQRHDAPTLRSGYDRRFETTHAAWCQLTVASVLLLQ